MKDLTKAITIVGVAALLAAPVSAELLLREDFNGVAPETFDDYAGWDMQDRDFDFGPFSIVGWFDTDGFQMPIAAPVERPTIGGYQLAINLHPPVSEMGFDLGAADFGETTIAFHGVDNAGAPIELATFLISELMDLWSGPSGYQGFVGFRDDLDREIHQVTVQPIDLYLDNIYIGAGATATDETSLGEIKTLFR